MSNTSFESYGPGPLQEFVDTVIDDPAELAALNKKLHRPSQRSRRLGKWTGFEAIGAAFKLVWHRLRLLIR
jgi:hypothetical protein